MTDPAFPTRRPAPKLLAITALLPLSLCFQALGCASSTQPANNPEPPPIEDSTQDSAPVAPASNALVEQGIEALRAQDYEAAKDVLSRAHAEDPKDPQAAFYLGVALEGLGDKDGAIDQYRAALELDQSLVEASVNLSALLLEKEQAEDALGVVNAALKQAPDHPGLLNNRALCLESMGDQAGALDAYKLAVKASPDNLELRYTYAELLFKANQPEKAKQELAMLKKVEEPALAGAVANLFGKLGAYDDCISMLNEFLERSKVADLFVRRGVCQHGAGNNKAALADYQAAVAQDPKFAPGYYYMGQHYKAAGQKAKAREQFNRAAELAQGTRFGEQAKAQADALK